MTEPKDTYQADYNNRIAVFDDIPGIRIQIYDILVQIAKSKNTAIQAYNSIIEGTSPEKVKEEIRLNVPQADSIMAGAEFFFRSLPRDENGIILSDHTQYEDSRATALRRYIAAYIIDVDFTKNKQHSTTTQKSLIQDMKNQKAPRNLISLVEECPNRTGYDLAETIYKASDELKLPEPSILMFTSHSRRVPVHVKGNIKSRTAYEAEIHPHTASVFYKDLVEEKAETVLQEIEKLQLDQGIKDEPNDPHNITEVRATLDLIMWANDIFSQMANLRSS